MPKEYRSRTRILHDILHSVHAEPGIAPTRLLFLSNLSHERLTDYLGDLKQRGLVEEREESARKSYHMTPAGERFLGELSKIQSFMRDFGLDI